MGLLDFIVKPAEDVINAITQPKTHAKQNGAVSQAASIAANGGNPLSVLQTPGPQAQPAPNVTTINGNSPMPSITSSPTDTQSAQATPQTTMPLEQKSVNTANAVANSPGGRFVQGVQTGASTNYDPTAYENQKGANSPEEYGAIAGSALPALGMADNPLQGMDMALPAINQAKAGVTGAVDETKANVAANGGMEAGYVGIGKNANQRLGALGYTTDDVRAMKPAQIKNIIDNNIEKSATEKPPLQVNDYHNRQTTATNETPQTTPLNPNAESFSSGTETKMPFTPHPDIPDDPDLVTGRKNGSPVRVDMRDEAKHNGSYLADQQKAQQVIDNYVPGRNSQEVEQNLPVKIGEESKRVQNIMSQDPNKTVDAQDIAAKNAENMASAGIRLDDNPVLNTSSTQSDYLDKARQSTESLQSELEAQATAGKSSFNPKLSGSDILNHIHNLDDRLQSVYKKIDNGTTLTPSERATLTYRRTLRNQLSEMYPKADTAIKRQAAMIDARPSVAKAAGDEIKQGNNQPKQSFLQKAKIPMEVGALGTGILGGLALTLNQPVVKGGLVAGEQAIQNAFGNKKGQSTTGQGNDYQYSQPTDNHYYANQVHISSDSIPQTQAQVKPDQYGNYPTANPQNIYDKYGNPVAMNESFYNNQKATLQGQQAKDLALYGDKSLQVASDNAALAKLEDLHNSSPDIQKAFNTVSQVSSLTAKVKSAAKNLPTSLLQSTTFDQLSSINNGAYTQLHTDITNLAKAYGIDPNVIWHQQDNNALLGTLDSIGQQNATNWNILVNGKTGNTGASNLSTQPVANTGAITGNSPMPAIQPQGKVQMYNGGGNTPLPAIPNFQQIGSQFAQ